MGQIVPSTLNDFLGLNESEDETNLKFGESPNMINWRITENLKLQKINGYKSIFIGPPPGKPITGLLYGIVNGVKYFFIVNSGKIYTMNLATNTNTEIGNVGNNLTTSLFTFNNILYIQDGSNYYKWTGTGTITVVEGYRPKVFIGCNPTTGSGTAFESRNLLNGLYEKTYTPDNGVTTDYIISSTAITSVDAVYKNGALLTLTTDYTVSLNPAKVSFVASPTGTVPDSIRILYTQGVLNDLNSSRDEIIKQRFNMAFGGARDSRVFMWGRDNKYYWSGLANGVPSAEYFPPENFNQTDSDGSKVTDIVMQYDRQIIFTDKPDSYYSYYDTTTDSNGNILASFPLFKLNATKGMVAPNQTQIINNNPFVINEGVYSLVGGTVRDERNMQYMSKRVQPSLNKVDLTKAITYDWEEKGEYWLCVGNTVWVYQYRVDVWFKLKITDFAPFAPTCFETANGKMYFGNSLGQVLLFDEQYTEFDGAPIEAVWEMEFFDSGVEYLRKFMNRTYISLSPSERSWVEVYFETNKSEAGTTPIDIYYSNIDFEDIDFNDFTFEGNYNPQPFRCKTKAKKWTYFKLILKNEKERYGALVLSINLLPRIGGFSK